MFFGRELKEPVEYARKADAIAAGKWVAKRTKKTVTLWELQTGGWHMSLSLWPGNGLITVGLMAALMQRHDKPAEMVQYEDRDGVTRARDITDVPLMSSLAYYDVLPKERPS